MNEIENEENLTGLEIAVIGMAGRFPLGKNIDEFWSNLINGKECISFYSDEELRESGIGEEMLGNPRFIRSFGWMDGIEYFDASFFGYTPVDAELMDPQVRMFHECALEVLENAGYDPYSYKKLIGIYGGAAPNLPWQALVELSGQKRVLGSRAVMHLSDKDFICTQVAYKLNLKGPVIVLDTACSTSLVAVHMACQGLISGDCDMALAGGASTGMIARSVRVYEEGMLSSPDGHTRAFDARARGANFGNAVGLVVLKRLEDALEDGDTIHAVIKGSAVNNDGAGKSAYTAPGIEGQARVIRTAHRMAEVDPETVGYVETHGTATSLGDPVEIEGLKAAFNTSERHFCRIGSVKTNVGHLEAAAGITGLIKTVLILKHRLIPPSLFFENPNPKIDFENSPFVVNSTLTHWERTNGFPLRAGVSSFGIGGTNAHVVLEEWSGNGKRKSADGERKQHLIVLSAKTGTSLDKMTENLSVYLKENPDIDIADVAYTLQIGRKVYPYRRILVCSDAREAAALLSDTNSGKIVSHCSREDNPPIIFIFPGQGAQYVNMGSGLYEEEPVFRDHMNRCFKLLDTLIEENLKEILYPHTEDNRSYSTYSEELNRSEIAQLAIFILEYALAELLISWGIAPQSMIGYSFGEYAAACVSGVFTLEEALKLIVFRGKLIRGLPAGAMLSVPLSMKDLNPLIQSNSNISLAVDNGPSCVISGTRDAVRVFEEQMKGKKLMCMNVPVPHALHSPLMDAVSRKFEDFLSTLTLSQPKIPYISNVTGTWITAQEAVDPSYWSKHLRQTVQFSDGMKELLKEPTALFVEVGPGRDIGTLTARHIETHGSENHRVVNIVRHSRQAVPDSYRLFKSIGKLWLYGHPIDWNTFDPREKKQRKRIPLPTYPFERQRFWIDMNKYPDSPGHPGVKVPPVKNTDLADWFYVPSWKRSAVTLEQAGDLQNRYRWLVFLDSRGIGSLLAQRLKAGGHDVITVSTGPGFSREEGGQYAWEFTMAPHLDSDYDTLFKELNRLNIFPDRIVHLWNVTGDRGTHVEAAAETMESGYYGLINIARIVGDSRPGKKIQLTVVTNNMFEVTGGDGTSPHKAIVLGPIRIIPTEYPDILCRAVDIVLSGQEGEANLGKSLPRQLMTELLSEAGDNVVAFRGGYRWVQAYDRRRFEESRKKSTPLRQGGVYLVTGGLGGVGMILAEYLAKPAGARLVLTGRKGLGEPTGDGNANRKLQKIKELEKWGAKVLVFSADVSDKNRMQEVIREAGKQFGPINGVIHCAGLGEGEIIRRRNRDSSRALLASKVYGTLVLYDLLAAGNLLPDFFILCSSVSSFLPMMGQVGYCAANAFLDAFANSRNTADSGGIRVVSINWDLWRGVGIANMAEEQYKKATGRELDMGITPEQGVDALQRIMPGTLPQVAVMERDLENLMKQAYALKDHAVVKDFDEPEIPGKLHPRPSLENEYTAPRDDVEQSLTTLWARFLGFEKVGILDDFIELGGDSLKAIGMLGRVQKELKVNVPLTEFFENPTIQWLAESIRRVLRITGDTGVNKETFSLIYPVEEREYYTLSPAQKRLFLLEKLGNTGTAYNIMSAVNIEGNLEVDRLKNAFHKMLKRHENFRTSFHLIDGEPALKIHREVKCNIEQYDLTEGWDFAHRFNLEQTPLVWVGLVKTGEEKYTLLVDMHHIISDGVSMINFVKEFILLYAGETLPELPLRYIDFSEWQNNLFNSGEMHRKENYWLAQFRDEIPMLDLPLDYARPSVRSFEGERIDFRLEHGDIAFLKRTVLEEDASLFIVMLTIYTVFLSKLSGQEDIVVGVPAAGRNNPDLEPIIGMFVNTLALRNFPSGEKQFPDFLKEVKENSLLAYENQDYPFEDLVDKVTVNRDTARNPLFDTMIVQQNNEIEAGTVPDLDIPGLKITPCPFIHNTSKFDIILELFDAGDHLSLSFEYCTALFRSQSIRRFITYFNHFLLSLREDPQKRLYDIEIIPDEEKSRILNDFNNTDAAYPGNKTIHGLFEEQVEINGDRTAVTGEAYLAERTDGRVTASGSDTVNIVSLTYRELNKKSDRIAHLLREKGVKAGDIVGIMMERSVEMITGIFGILKAGGAYMPIAPDYPDERTRYILEDSGAKILLSTKSELSGEDEKFHTQPGDLAYVIYTSGSTGKPKGVLVEHRSVVNRIHWMQEYYPIGARDVILQKTTVVFDVSVWELFWWSFCGASLFLLEAGGEKSPGSITKAIVNHNITTMHFVPSMLNVFLEYLEGPGGFEPPAALKQVFTSGEVLEVHHVRRFNDIFRETRLVNLYGPTEATVDVSYYNCRREIDLVTVPIGKPISNIRLYVVDRGLHLQPVGIPGELCITGVGLARGYLNRPELTAEKFYRSDWSYRTYTTNYRTGDLARWLPDGNIEFLGRIDHQVKIRGFRIEPGEIEKRLLTHEQVKEAVVLDFQKKSGEKELCAYFTAQKAVDISQLREFLARQLPAYMIPAYFMQLENIPLTPNGKIDRKQLSSFSPAIKTAGRFTAPEKENEIIIAAAWKEVLELEQVGIDDNFFELGGNSLGFVKVNMKLNEVFSREIPVVIMFKYPTIRSFAQYLSEETSHRMVERSERTQKGINRMQNLRDKKKKKN